MDDAIAFCVYTCNRPVYYLFKFITFITVHYLYKFITEDKKNGRMLPCVLPW